MAKTEGQPVEIAYRRLEDVVRFKTVNVDTEELRSYILALWLVLDGQHRKDMIRELAHYHEAPNTRLPGVARAIADAYAKAQA